MDTGLRRKMEGVVISNLMEKTAVVRVERLTKHRAYGKYLRRHAKYMAHDPQNLCRVGDKVQMIESRPLSKRKRWQILKVVEKASIVG